MAKFKTINVIEIVGGVFSSIHTFSTDEEGKQEAKSLFKKTALENGAEESDLESYILDDGHFESDDYDLIMVHSNN